MPKAGEDRVVVAQGRGPGAGARLEQADRPSVLLEASARRDRAPAHLLTPVALGIGKLDLLEDEVDEPVEELVLAGDVVVDRHRLGAELLRERTDGQARQTTSVGDGDGRAQHAFVAQPGAGRPSVTAGSVMGCSSAFFDAALRFRTMYHSLSY